MKSTQYIILLIIAASTCFQANAQNIPDPTSVLPNPQGSGPGAVPRHRDYIQTVGGNPVYPTLFNYSRRYIPLEPMTSIPAFDLTKNKAIHVTTNYKNGFGTPLMTIQRNGSSKDIIQPYDLRNIGVSASYLPYPDSSHRKFRLAPFAEQANYYQAKFPEEEETAYSKTEITTENGIKVTKSYAPGLMNVGMQNGTTSSEHINSGTELPVVYYSGGSICKANYWPASTLFISKEVNAHGQETIRYVDKSNKLICKKVRDNGSSVDNVDNYLFTYYIYNDLGKLLYIVPPKAYVQLHTSTCISNIDELCFSFKYDRFGNVIEKYTPGKSGPDELVYDKNYKPVLSRSANMANDNQWAWTIYDKQGRTVMSGIYTGALEADYWREMVIGNTAAISRGVPQEETLEYWLKNYFSGSSYPQNIDSCEIHTYNYYDNYDYIPNGIPIGFDYSDTADFLTGPTIITPKPYMYAHSKLVASQTRILDNGIANNFTNTPWITSVYYYDEEGRVIQTHTLNPWNTTDWDIVTVQFNFSGSPVLEISNYNSYPQSTKPLTKISNKYTYGSMTGRLETVQQKIDTGAWQPISGYHYDEMGNIVVKWLGNVEEQVYSYDIRGKSTGVNADSIMNTNISNVKTFYSKLHYDHGYTNARYDGQISGFMWRTRGSDVMSYGYEYDDVNRLVSAEFRAFNSVGGGANTWNKSNTDFTVSGIDYDVNGNMQHMNQRGYDAGNNPVDIDQLSYYYDVGNNLIRVEDGGMASAPYIHDFDNGTSGPGNDYTYDLNGNLKSDANKDITDISYNHMDLPLNVTANSGTVDNIYTASGSLLQKIITENGQTDTIRYWGPFVYKNDTLNYILQPEGRARYDSDSDKFTYDFFIKDHLGNVRTIVEGSSSYDQIEYHAGWEIIAANIEEAIFENIGEVRAGKPAPVSSLDIYSGKLNGAISGECVGASMLVHTMAGDQFNLEGWAYYEQEEPEGYNMYTMEEEMLNSLVDIMTGNVGEGGEGPDPTEVINNLLTPTNYAMYDALKHSITNSTYPRIYLNYLVFNEQFDLLPQYCQAIQIQGGANAWHKLELPTRMTMPVTGYLMVYMSNESPMDAAVDNEILIHYESNLLEENHYYPHGLVIEAGSTATEPKNDYLHQGKKLQRELGMELYDFHARQYDPQIGRFWGIDLADQFPSGYTGMGNDPANMIDPSGLYSTGIAGEAFGIQQHGQWAQNRRMRDLLEPIQMRIRFHQNNVPQITIQPRYDFAGSRTPSHSDRLDMFLAKMDQVKAQRKADEQLKTDTKDKQNDKVSKNAGTYETEEGVVFSGEDNEAARSIVERHKKGLISDMERDLMLADLAFGNGEGDLPWPGGLPEARGIVVVDGIKYDMNAFNAFFDKHSNTPVYSFYGNKAKVAGAHEWELNGVPFSPYAEVNGNLVMKNGIVTTGINIGGGNDLTRTMKEPESEPGAIFGVGIHTHPPTGLIEWYNDMNIHQGVTTYAGPSRPTAESPNDMGSHMNHDGIRSVVVDPNYIYLYNSHGYLKYKR